MQTLFRHSSPPHCSERLFLADTPTVLHHKLRRLLHIMTDQTGINTERGLDPMTYTFTSFLMEPSRISPFSSIVGAHDQVAAKCLKILVEELRFNICQFPSSFMRSSDVNDLTKIADLLISPQLRYACCYWMHHVAYLREIHSEMVTQISDFFQTQFLPWLEVMSILGTPPAQCLRTLLSSDVRYPLL